MHYITMKISNKRELIWQQMAFNYLSGNDFQDFINLYKKCTANPYIYYWYYSYSYWYYSCVR